MAPTEELERIKEENIRFPDATAAGYDAKWLVGYEPEDQASARSQLGAVLGEWPAQPFGDAGFVVAPLWRRALRLPPRGEEDGSATISQSEIDRLEKRVDVHTFTPGALREAAAGAGFVGIRVGGEEFLAALWGWTLRGFYATTDASRVPERWTRLALAVLRLTRRLDRALLERLVPTAVLYSLGLSARRP